MMKIHGSMAKDREILCMDTYVTIHWSFSTFQVMYTVIQFRWYNSFSESIDVF